MIFGEFTFAAYYLSSFPQIFCIRLTQCQTVGTKKTVKILILIGFEDKQTLGKQNSFNEQTNM